MSLILFSMEIYVLLQIFSSFQKAVHASTFCRPAYVNDAVC